MANDRHYSVVGLRAPGGRVHDDEDCWGIRAGEGWEGHCNGNIRLAEHLLKTVEREAGVLRLDEVRSVLHHNFQLAVSLFTLPHGHKVQHMHTLCLFALLLTTFTAELDAAHSEQWSLCCWVNHLDEPRVKVNFRGKRRDCY
jgi:hypothetical protein